MKQDSYETCRFKYRLNASVFNNNHRWNKINAAVNGKNWLTKEYMRKNLFGILVIVNVNVINHLVLENI